MTFSSLVTAIVQAEKDEIFHVHSDEMKVAVESECRRLYRRDIQIRVVHLPDTHPEVSLLRVTTREVLELATLLAPGKALRCVIVPEEMTGKNSRTLGNVLVERGCSVVMLGGWPASTELTVTKLSRATIMF